MIVLFDIYWGKYFGFHILEITGIISGCVFEKSLFAIEYNYNKWRIDILFITIFNK